MNWVDYVCGLILLAGAFVGFKKGAVGSIISLASYAAGTFLSIAFYRDGGDIILGYFNMSVGLARLVAFVIIFLTIFLLIRGIGFLLSKLAGIAVTGLEKVGGILLGLVLGCLLITMLAVVVFTIPKSGLRDILAESSILRFAVNIVSRLLTAIVA